MTADFGTLTFERKLNAAPARVFTALTNPADRMAWGPPSPDMVVLIDEGQPAAAPGVREMSRVGPRDNPYVDVATDWIDLVPGQRVVFAETLMAEGDTLAVSLATYELTADGDGTAMKLTTQIANFAGAEMMGEIEGGWSHAVDSLIAHV